jgi:SAM-dependent methyltransferase
MVQVWASGGAYEPYVGRWSRLVAQEFLPWLGVARDGSWVDVGCGTGALTATILATQNPRSVDGVEPSEGFLNFAREHNRDERATFTAGDAAALPLDPASRDAVVSGLVLNFVPDAALAVAEWRRVLRSGGVAAAYVWDYAGEMQMMRYFWDAATLLDAEVMEIEEAKRFPLCKPEPLADLWRSCGLAEVEVRAINVPTVFADFDDYWSPFLGGQGAAPAYAMTLSDEQRSRLRERLRGALPYEADGSIRLIARAWAVKGRA